MQKPIKITCALLLSVFFLAGCTKQEVGTALGAAGGAGIGYAVGGGWGAAAGAAGGALAGNKLSQ
jgi:hypothetical protein